MPLILVPPVDAPIVRPFDYAGSPFAAGLHRGVDFDARPGTVVRAPCSGELVWVGRAAATLVCGGRRVTLVDFAPDAAAEAVRTGEPVGRTGTEPLHLGVRRPGDPFGYEDPEHYLLAPPAPVAPVAPPLRRFRLPPRPAPGRPPAAATPSLAPPLAWAGLAVVLLGAAGGRRRWASGKRKRHAVPAKPRRVPAA